MLLSCANKSLEENGMQSREQIITEIEAVVATYGFGRYGMWLIGVTVNTDEMEKERCYTRWYRWEAETDYSAIAIKNYFVEKGMVPDYVLNMPGRFVYMC